MTARAALGAFFLSAVLIAVAYGSAFLPEGTPRWGPFLLAVGAAGSMTSAMTLGAAGAGRPLGVLAPVFLVTFVLVAGGFSAALLLPAEAATSPLWLGLPRRAAILIYGIGLLPVVLLPVAYAATFDRTTLSEEDLARFRERLAQVRRDAMPVGEAPPAPGNDGNGPGDARRRPTRGAGE